jgi:hypothetical protein
MISQMSQREKMLALLVGGAVAVFLNVLILNFFLSKYREYRTAKMEAEGKLANFKVLETERDRWAKRDVWLSAQLTPLGDKDVVDKAQRDALQALAKKHEILIENVARGTAIPMTNYTEFKTSLDCKAKWDQLIFFLHELQSPENFTVVNPVDIRVDPNDKTQFKANITVVKWFAPAGKS